MRLKSSKCIRKGPTFRPVYNVPPIHSSRPWVWIRLTTGRNLGYPLSPFNSYWCHC
ncbi:hypothetical protein I79_013699 [Cricetulus griseus]|uniref:Uncharacterized protein n=1 Tax=Cricetulus griseus TaxID=10029 RepID=G3HS73_CRIGR|nr:hypothetical protein I79_013699 [Cricetulus griseus]